MINYLKNYFSTWKNRNFRYKIIFILVLFLYLSFILISTIKINYISLSPGEVSLVESVIQIEEGEDTGEIFTVSVFEFRKLTLLQYLLASTNSDIDIATYDPTTSLSDQEEQIQGEIMKEVSINNAIIMAYTEANKYDTNITIDYTFQGMIIHTTFSETDSSIQLGDIVTHIEGTKINTVADIETLVVPVFDDDNRTTIHLTVKRGEEVVEINPAINQTSEGKYIGIAWYPYYTINESTPSYTLRNTLTTGPSGGLMQAIAVYNAITEQDITNGLRIMGTGTIDIDGTVGEIGGIRQKIITANIYNADLFFVPDANYADALAQYQALDHPHYPAPVKVGSFSEAIAYLEGYGD